jgi:hypothetical protein
MSDNNTSHHEATQNKKRRSGRGDLVSVRIGKTIHKAYLMAGFLPLRINQVMELVKSNRRVHGPSGTQSWKSDLRNLDEPLVYIVWESNLKRDWVPQSLIEDFEMDGSCSSDDLTAPRRSKRLACAEPTKREGRSTAHSTRRDEQKVGEYNRISDFNHGDSQSARHESLVSRSQVHGTVCVSQNLVNMEQRRQRTLTDTPRLQAPNNKKQGEEDDDGDDADSSTAAVPGEDGDDDDDEEYDEKEEEDTGASDCERDDEYEQIPRERRVENRKGFSSQMTHPNQASDSSVDVESCCSNAKAVMSATHILSRNQGTNADVRIDAETEAGVDQTNLVVPLPAVNSLVQMKVLRSEGLARIEATIGLDRVLVKWITTGKQEWRFVQEIVKVIDLNESPMSTRRCRRLRNTDSAAATATAATAYSTVGDRVPKKPGMTPAGAREGRQQAGSLGVQCIRRHHHSTQSQIAVLISAGKAVIR